MKFALKQFFKLLCYSIIFWSFAFCSFIVIRYYGRNHEQVTTVDLNEAALSSEYLIFGLIMGLMVGTVYAIIEFLSDKFLSKILHLGFIILFKSIIYLVLLVFSLTLIAYLAESYINVNFPNQRGWWMSNKIFWIVTTYFILCSLIFTLIRLANDKFGRGVIFNMVIGRYRKPREVERILMFIDLKSSTTIAETLGHLKYSQFIQDCFYFLNRTVGKYDAEIYQYVGDEAVLTWRLKKGLKKLNCLHLFFEFKKRLNKNSKYFMKKYGVIPEFKAGLHSGKIIITEVGTIKKELAYHGDVINTTSRIQEQCNDYNESLLISEELLLNLKLTSNFKSVLLGEELLEGKTETLTLHAIHKT